jgi:PQQ-dependent catabolism-associated CXXCW motif protein
MRLAVPLLAALLAASPAAAEPPPQPEGYRMQVYRAPTPAALDGAEVADLARARALWETGEAAFVDVLPRPPRPEGLPADTYWRPRSRASVPGAIWLPNIGFGAVSEEVERYLMAGLAAARDGDDDRPLVIFCDRDCWMSWNAAKRAVALGLAPVIWFPEGVDGWAEAGLPLEEAEPWGPE